MQNAAARTVLGIRACEHITPALKSLHWLPIHQRICYKLSLLVYSALHGLAPSYLRALLTPVSEVPGRSSLRSASLGDLVLPPTRLKMCERAFSVSGPREWNSLPSDVRNIKDISTFKKQLKTYLFKEYFND